MEPRICSPGLLQLLLSVVVLFPSAPPGLAQDFSHLLPGGTEVEFSFMPDTDLSACQTVEFSAAKMLIQCSEHDLLLTVHREAGAHILNFRLYRPDGKPFKLLHYSAGVTIPYAPGNGIWSYNQIPKKGIINASIDQALELDTAPNIGIPFALLADRSGINRLALGLLHQDRIVALRGAADAGKKSYRLSATQMETIHGASIEDTFYISRKSQNWFRIAELYARSVDRARSYRPSPLSEAVFKPTYDTWYWTQDRINQQLLWEVALSAQKIGFENFLIDAGWDTLPGEYFKWLDGSTGDYQPPPQLFPDFPGLLDRIRNLLGMRVMLWTQQYALGRKSVQYPRYNNALTYILEKATGQLVETPALCPRVDSTQQYMTELFERLVDEYRPDSFWFDWQDGIPSFCNAPHFHSHDTFGQGYNTTQQVIADTIRMRNPKIFVEMRWPSANLNNKPYTQLWQPFDAPGDIETMRLQAMNMRPFSSGVAIGTDEMYWSPGVSDATAAKFMATVVFSGVPYFGPNLLKEPQRRRDMLRAWLEFYKVNRADLTSGEFEPYGSFNRPDQKIEGPQRTFIFYKSRYGGIVNLHRANARIYIVNASSVPGIDIRLSGLAGGRYQAEISDLYLRKAGEQTLEINPEISTDGATRIMLNVPVGCMLTLTRFLPGYQDPLN